MPVGPLRLEIVAATPEAAGPAGYVLAPWLEALPVPTRDFSALLPVADLNALTLEALPPPGGAAPGAAAALMLADPFMRVRDTVRRLAAAGIGRVANFPTVQLIDGEAARALEGAGLGLRREAQTLAAFRAAGIGGIGFARDLAAARALRAAGAGLLVLHPGVALADWRSRAAAAVAILRVVAALREEGAGVPVLVYRPAGFGAELDQAVAAAGGEAVIGQR